MFPRETLIMHRQYAPVKRNKGTCKNICINYKIKLKVGPFGERKYFANNNQ